MAGAAERRWMPMVWSSCWGQLTCSHSAKSSRAAKSGHSRVPSSVHGRWAASPPTPLPPPRRRRPQHHRCSLDLSLAGAPLCLGPLYWIAARRCRLSPVLVDGISFSGINKSMAPWFCTRSLVRQPPPDTTEMEKMWKYVATHNNTSK